MADQGKSNNKGTLVNPVAGGGTNTSGYGYRIQPAGRNKGKRKFHQGLDIAAPNGTPMLAPGDGVVTYAGPAGNAGNVVVIDHGNGTVSRIFHMGKISVNKGDPVKQGKVIGTVGSTGDSTGPHAHWEVLRGKTQGVGNGFGEEIKRNHMDPRQFLKSSDKSSIPTENQGSNTIASNNGSPASKENQESSVTYDLVDLNKKLYTLAEEASGGDDKKLVDNLRVWGENGMVAYSENHPSLNGLSANEKAQEVNKVFSEDQNVVNSNSKQLALG
jgi:hypothetical protein